MNIGDNVYCVDESSYNLNISKRKKYEVFEIGTSLKEQKIRIKDNNGRLVWIPIICFSLKEEPEIISLKIDDKIRDPLHACVEVTIKYSNSKKRYLTFMTIKYMDSLINDSNKYRTGGKIVFVREVNETIIKETINELDRTNELKKLSIKY